MNSHQLVQALNVHDSTMTAEVLVDVAGEVKAISHVTTLSNGEPIVVIIPVD